MPLTLSTGEVRGGLLPSPSNHPYHCIGGLYIGSQSSYLYLVVMRISSLKVSMKNEGSVGKLYFYLHLAIVRQHCLCFLIELLQ